MNIKYEKHQRDYTILASSIIMHYFFGKEIRSLFPFSLDPTYLLVRDGVFYHFVSERSYDQLGASWLKSNNVKTLIKYEQEINKEFIKYKRFLKKEHTDYIESLIKVHEYFNLFLPIQIISAYALTCSKSDIISPKLKEVLLKTRRKYDDVHKNAMSLQEKLLRKLEKQNNLEKGALSYLTMQEFNDFIDKNIVPKGLNKRKDFLLLEYTRRGEVKINKSDSRKKLIELEGLKISKKISHFTGQIASPGKAVGKVKIIQLIEDASDLKKGDVLVTSMTDPRYLMAMKIASAIITDEGGITCHAAIVSREIKTPCIIGTKIATQVLKNGDIVEVDADKGIVKIKK